MGQCFKRVGCSRVQGLVSNVDYHRSIARMMYIGEREDSDKDLLGRASGGRDIKLLQMHSCSSSFVQKTSIC